MRRCRTNRARNFKTEDRLFSLSSVSSPAVRPRTQPPGVAFPALSLGFRFHHALLPCLAHQPHARHRWASSKLKRSWSAWRRQIRAATRLALAETTLRYALCGMTSSSPDQSDAAVAPGAGWPSFLEHQYGLCASATAQRSAGAQYLSSVCSRSCTLLEALRRTRRLPTQRKPLRLLVAGADRTEGCSGALVVRTFDSLCSQLLDRRAPPAMLHLHLQGPNAPQPSSQAPFSTTYTAYPARRQLSESDSQGDDDTVTDSDDDSDDAAATAQLPSLAVHVTFARSCVGEEDGAVGPFDLAIAFNAGVWGYGASWLSSLAYLSRTVRTPCVVTAYSQAECEEDAEVIEDAGLRLLWSPEANPFASLRPWTPLEQRGHALAEEEDARAENAWWLCIASEEE